MNSYVLLAEVFTASNSHKLAAGNNITLLKKYFGQLLRLTDVDVLIEAEAMSVFSGFSDFQLYKFPDEISTFYPSFKRNEYQS